ncbi:hypothetical protein NDU88_004349 [Pleurodeles waltl]|uniref:Uncharacterized protein n=1 Tax=Pleurodeles waltl TaxID=8319 RepID=A0AAV7RH18_PLEWA|nr:hypothetical protein NDU88_004349 [Pleurodeles waltl]
MYASRGQPVTQEQTMKQSRQDPLPDPGPLDFAVKKGKDAAGRHVVRGRLHGPKNGLRAAPQNENGTKDGIKPKKELLSAILDAPVPINTEELRSFLGLMEFHAKFVRTFSEKTYGMRQLLKCKVKFEWTEVLQEEFESI